MELQFTSRNNDLGVIFPTFQERVNAMLPAQAACNAAPELEPQSRELMSPHFPNNDEVRETIARVEAEAAQQNEELIQMHSGLNEQRVARLLGLLD